ncbi:DUF1772 domain-containing protein [Streptomyces sp. N2-109]|uniref:DUF1772 domain-containing protein n=1 Tax=Streptomyces gossypii TaxID=2883101 RepID=A0ABT2K0E6_9ACTN|nr:anthrone oxygenase family protein [Streptomyces gossypii]MCT2593642.1 DUF1772 domain-containing protein [Streptomyces gossypii]
MQGVTLGAATVLTGLMAGIYFAFSVAVMPGLAATNDETFVRSMQSVNVKILNGWFMLAFFGALLLPALAGVLLFRDGGMRAVVVWVVAAFVLYAATIGITAGVNVPLNDKLAAAGSAAGDSGFAAAREQFETVWVRGNAARALLATAACGCLVRALIVHANG